MKRTLYEPINKYLSSETDDVDVILGVDSPDDFCLGSDPIQHKYNTSFCLLYIHLQDDPDCRGYSNEFC